MMCAVGRVRDEWRGRGMSQRTDNTPYHKRSGVRNVRERRLFVLQPRYYLVEEEVSVHYKRAYHIFCSCIKRTAIRASQKVSQ